MPEKIHLTRSDIKQYGMSPVGVVTPMYIGQYCITDDNKVFFAKGLTSNDWIEASGSGGDELLETLSSLQGEVSANKTNIQLANSNISALQNELGVNKSTLEAHINSIREVL